jgi:predicted phage terminase large subunit-like protein
VRIIGNVKGRKNWAYKLARRAEHGRPGYHYAKLTVWDAVEADIFPKEEAEDAKDMLPEAVYKELYLAEAAADSEQFFQTEHIGIIEEAPKDLRVVRIWDFAVTEADDVAFDPDYTVGLKMGYDGRRIIVLDVVSRRSAPDKIIDLVQTTAMADGPRCPQLFEEEKGAAGKMMVSIFKRRLNEAGGVGRVIPVPVTGSKPVRAFHFAAAVNDDRVMLLEAPWNARFLEELDDFPDEGHDDQVDAAAYGYNHLVPAGTPRVRYL